VDERDRALTGEDPGPCRACGLGGLGLPKLRAVGPPDAEVAVVGINPSVRTMNFEAGAFFVPTLAKFWASGRWRALRLGGSPRAFAAIADGAGLDLARVFSANLVKCATPGNRRPTPEEVTTCAERFLRRELEALPDLRAVLIFGRVAGVALGLSDFGEVSPVEGTAAVGILLRHPISTLRKWTRLPTETETVRGFLTRFAPSSLRTRS
jgi:uracil-DNA glycosylase